MTPKQLVRQWILLFNSTDANKLIELYDDNAICHKVTSEPVVGKEAIRKMFVSEFFGEDMVCTPENIFEDGDWAIMEWRDFENVRGCVFFQLANGKIKLQREY